MIKLKEILEAEELNEVGVFPIRSYVKKIIPKGRLNTFTPEERKDAKNHLKDLQDTLNQFWKDHNIPYMVKGA